MIASGMAWGVYSLRGRGAGDSMAVSRGNFIRAAPMALALLLPGLPLLHPTPDGVALAVASGSITSGVGYVVWYSVTPHLKAVQAATVQLSVPLLAAAVGVM